MSLPISDSTAFARARAEVEKASEVKDTKSNADLHRGRTPAKPKPKVSPKARPKGSGGTFDESKHKRKSGGWGGKKVKGAGQFESKGGGGEAKAGSVGASGRSIKVNTEAGNPRKGKQYVEIDDPKGRGKIHVYANGQKFLVRDKPKPESAASASDRGKATEANARAQAEAKEAKARSKGKVRKATDVMDDLDISIDQAHEMMAQADIDCGCDECMVQKSFYEEPYTEDDDDAEAFEEQEFESEPEYAIYKSSDEKRRTVGVLYMPDTVDAHGEFVANDELENATVEFFQKGNFDIRHQHRPGTVLGEIVGVMSWPYETEVELMMPAVAKSMTTTGGFGGVGQAPLSVDQMTKTKRKLPPGTVYATVQWTPMAWPLVKSGAIGGFSMGGRGVRVRGATPATEGRKPEMQGGAGTGVGSAGAGHLAGPRPAGAQAAAGAYDGEGQLRKHALGFSDPGSLIDLARTKNSDPDDCSGDAEEFLKRALSEPGDEEIYDMIRPVQADEMGGEAVPVEIDRYLLEEGAEMADEEDGEYDEEADDMDDDPTARLLVLAAMGNRTARAMINLAGGSSVMKAADSPMKAATPKKGLETAPGSRDNWVERTPAGKLPNYIEHVALAIHRKRGMPKSQAIAMAIGTIKRWAAGGGNVDAGTRAAAARAVAEWESLKASSRG